MTTNGANGSKPLLDIRELRRILILRLSSIGDTILTAPLVAAIKDANPAVEVDWAVGAKSVQIVQMCEGVSKIFVVPRLMKPKAMLAHPVHTARLASELREVSALMHERHYDVALDVQGLLKSGSTALLASAATTIGWLPWQSREMSWLASDYWVPMPEGQHVTDCWMSMLSALSIQRPEVRFPLRPPQDATDWARQYLRKTAGNSPVVVMNVGASKTNKMWSAAKFGEVARMSRQAYGVVLLFTWGNDAERERAAAAVEAAGEGSHLSPMTTLFTLAALLSMTRAYVGGDTGPTHLAAAFGVPCVGLYGETDPARSRPYGEQHRIISRWNPALATKQVHEESPIMEQIEPEEVFRELSVVMQRHGEMVGQDQEWQTATP